MVAAAGQRFGRVDILVNNAGIIRPAMLHKMTEAQWDEVLDVHLKGSFNCLRAVAPGMMEQRYGRIINVTSTAGVLGTIGQINYSAAKAGIVGLTMSAARELAKHGITVNAVAPGAATQMTETIRTDERFKTKYLERIPMGRWAEPEEIAPVFVFPGVGRRQLCHWTGAGRGRWLDHALEPANDHAFRHPRFRWDDPLLLDDQLSDEERMVRDSARDYCQEKLLNPRDRREPP